MSTKTVEELQDDLRVAGEALRAARIAADLARLAQQGALADLDTCARDAALAAAALVEAITPEVIKIQVGSEVVVTDRTVNA